MADPEGPHPIPQKKSISLSHVNVRESISFLILRLIIVEVILLPFFLIAIFCISAVCFLNTNWYYVIFLSLASAKFLLDVFIMLRWLYEYYEITPKAVVCKRGIVFRDKEIYPYEHIRALKIVQGMFGRFLNYGTLEIFDWDARKFIMLYQIHNPHKYANILDQLIPHLDVIEETFLDAKEPK